MTRTHAVTNEQSHQELPNPVRNQLRSPGLPDCLTKYTHKVHTQRYHAPHNCGVCSPRRVHNTDRTESGDARIQEVLPHQKPSKNTMTAALVMLNINQPRLLCLFFSLGPPRNPCKCFFQFLLRTYYLSPHILAPAQS